MFDLHPKSLIPLHRLYTYPYDSLLFYHQANIWVTEFCQTAQAIKVVEFNGI